MASLSNIGVRLAGLAAAVPRTRLTVADDAAMIGKPLDEVMRVAESIGVMERRVSNVLCTSDLCTAAAQRLLAESRTAASEIDALVFVSQTADYFMPASACVIQHRLGLGKGCIAFDISLGCSGFVYGLSVVSSLMQSGQIRKALLLCGETSSRFCERTSRYGDKWNYAHSLLFGDAGSAALLVHDDAAAPMHFVLGSDGNGAKNLLVRMGASRNPPTISNIERQLEGDGVHRTQGELHMNGPEVFAFTLREVTPMAAATMALANWTLDEVQAVVMHQANTFMLKHLGKRLKIPEGKLVVDMERWGNTSSASIPLAMVSSLSERLRSEALNLLLCGFGVGLSWAGLALKTEHIVVPALVEVDDDFAYSV